MSLHILHLSYISVFTSRGAWTSRSNNCSKIPLALIDCSSKEKTHHPLCFETHRDPHGSMYLSLLCPRLCGHRGPLDYSLIKFIVAKQTLRRRHDAPSEMPLNAAVSRAACMSACSCPLGSPASLMIIGTGSSWCLTKTLYLHESHWIPPRRLRDFQSLSGSQSQVLALKMRWDLLWFHCWWTLSAKDKTLVSANQLLSASPTNMSCSPRGTSSHSYRSRQATSRLCNRWKIVRSF